MRIRWTSYRFVRPSTITEDQFLTARLYPRAFRRNWLGGLISLSAPVLARAVISVGAAVFAWRVIATSEHTSIIEAMLAMAAILFGASGALSALSFGVFAIKHAAFWARIPRMAAGHDDFASFSREFASRQSNEEKGSRVATAVVGLTLLLAILVITATAGETARPTATAQTPLYVASSADTVVHSPPLNASASDTSFEAPDPLTPQNQVPRSRVHLPEPGEFLPTASLPRGTLLERVASQVFDEAIDLLGDYRLTKALRFRAEICGDGRSAFYRPAVKRVTLCYEYLDELYVVAARDSLALPWEMARDMARFAVAHEVGHALIDEFSLPVTGREEDAADQFAAVQFANHERFLPLLAAIVEFGRYRTDRLDPSTLADVHSLDGQRRANLACWLLAADSTKLPANVAGLPASRTAQCSAEFRQVQRSWERLVRPYRR